MTIKYKLHIEEAEKHITKNWGEDNQEIIQDYLKMVNEICSNLFYDIEYCWFMANSLEECCGIKPNHYQICEITNEGKENFLTQNNMNNKLGKVKIFIDDSGMANKTKMKEFICKVFDYETRTKVISEKIHLSNLSSMMNSDESQQYSDDEHIFDLPLKLLIDLDGKPAGYANPYSDYNRKLKIKSYEIFYQSLSKNS